MAQGQPDGWSIGPVGQDGFDQPLVQGAQSQGMELPCDAESHHSAPAPGEPGCATVLVAVAGPQGQNLERLRGGWQWTARG
eukprot:7717394-Alexandrium_andersonii.AAC.1